MYPSYEPGCKGSSGPVVEHAPTHCTRTSISLIAPLPSLTRHLNRSRLTAGLIESPRVGERVDSSRSVAPACLTRRKPPASHPNADPIAAELGPPAVRQTYLVALAYAERVVAGGTTPIRCHHLPGHGPGAVRGGGALGRGKSSSRAAPPLNWRHLPTHCCRGRHAIQPPRSV